MTKKEIINDVANFYNLGNRSIAISSIGREACLYTNSECNHCAVGRYLKKEYQSIDFEHNMTSAVSLDNEGGIDKFLKSKVHGHSYKFWSDLQSLHDTKSNWTNEGLSNTGKSRVQKLLKKWKD